MNQAVQTAHALKSGLGCAAPEAGALDLTRPEDFDTIVVLYQKKLYRFLLGMLRDPDAAESLAQDCLLKAYENRAGFRGQSSVSTWLLSIAVNLVRDHRRNRRLDFWRKLFQSAEQYGAAAAAVPDRHSSPEGSLLARERMETVWQAVEQLSTQQRAVFLLRFVEEMSLEEIAEVTRLKVGTVKVHLFRAVHAVRGHAHDRRKQ